MLTLRGVFKKIGVLEPNFAVQPRRLGIFGFGSLGFVSGEVGEVWVFSETFFFEETGGGELFVSCFLGRESGRRGKGVWEREEVFFFFFGYQFVWRREVLGVWFGGCCGVSSGFHSFFECVLCSASCFLGVFVEG